MSLCCIRPDYLILVLVFALAVVALMVWSIARRLPKPSPKPSPGPTPTPLPPPPTGTPSIRKFRITQTDPRSVTNMAITGIKPGATGTFAESPVPPGTPLPAGVIPQWSSSDTTNTSLTPSADGTSCLVAVPSSATIASFVLTVKATLPDGTTPSGNATVPVLQPEVTGFTISQTA